MHSGIGFLANCGQIGLLRNIHTFLDYLYTRRLARYACFFFGEGRKRDKQTNGQTHIGKWVKNVTNQQTHIGGWVENVTNGQTDKRTGGKKGDITNGRTRSKNGDIIDGRMDGHSIKMGTDGLTAESCFLR